MTIGEWVMREACRQCKQWQRDGLQPLRVAVNVTASQFRHGNLLSVIRRAVEEVGLEPRYLELEITESAVMTNPEESTAILEQLSRMGVLVSVDDFGTGYSSMSYLRRFRRQAEDRRGLERLDDAADDVSIVRAIISLAHSLRLKVVAEALKLRAARRAQVVGAIIPGSTSCGVPAAAFGELMRSGRATDSLSEPDAIRLTASCSLSSVARHTMADGRHNLRDCHRRANAARLVVIDAADRFCCSTCRIVESAVRHGLELPGGGMEEDERSSTRNARAARGTARDQAECIEAPRWRRQIEYIYRGVCRHQRELVALVRISESSPSTYDSLRVGAEKEDVIEARWWSIEQIVTSSERLYPRSLPTLLPRFLAGESLEEPLEIWTA